VHCPGAPGSYRHLRSGQACCHRWDNAGSRLRPSPYIPVCRPDSNSSYHSIERLLNNNQSAAVPFGDLFFWCLHNSSAILRMAQRLSENHAHSFPLHGTSISSPSVLTADPNFMGQYFCDGIKKNYLNSNEPFFLKKRTCGSSHHSIRNDDQYIYNPKRF
jgi:hypothetical protein